MPGETIVRQGESADAVLRLLSGRVVARIVPGEDAVPDDDAVERRARPVGIDENTGDMPAESGALVEDRACSLVAVTEVEIETFPARPERLERMIAEEPALGLSLAEDLGRKLLRTAHGIALVDGRLSELGREVDRHEAALDRLVRELVARRGGIARMAARAKERATSRSGGTQPPRSRGSRRTSLPGRNERKRAAEAAALLADTASGEIAELAAGQWLCREGDNVPSGSGRRNDGAPVFLVLAGELEVVARGRHLGRARENELAGELAGVLPGLRRRPLGFRGTRPSRVLCIPGAGLGPLVTARPALAVHLVRVLSRRLVRAYHVLAEVQEDASALVRRLDGPEGSLASAFAALGAGLSDWADDVPEIVREVGGHLARVRGCARDARAWEDDFERELLGGASFRELLARREFADAGAHLRRAFERLRGHAPEDDDGADASEDVLLAASAVYEYAGVGPGARGLEAGAEPLRGPGKADLERHCIGTAAWALLIAERIGCGVRESSDLALAALLHDVGMLRAESGLEFAMESHPTEYATGYLVRLKGLPPVVVPAVCQHHEYVDGSGYPRRLTGERMCLGGKVLSVANQVDLLLAKGLAPPEAAQALSAEASRYDPACLSAALEIIAEGPAADGPPPARGAEARR
jgi:CRP-like cAMP-binding protein